jgi:hypothetical protein
MRRIVPFAKPAKAFSEDSNPVRTDAETAKTDAVRIGKALTTTEAMVVPKMAKSRHASTVRPVGGGTNHSPTATSTVAD